MQARSFFASCALAIALAGTASATPTFALSPASGTIFGGPGQTIGWGFTITNTVDYLLVTSVNFLPTPSASIGTFTDFIAQFNFIVVGPSPESTTVSQAFNLGLQQGTGSFAISPTAVIGSKATGNLQFTYDLYSVSPNDINFDPTADAVSLGNVASQAAEVDVTPEPASFVLVGSALAALGFTVRRLRRAA